MTAGEPIPVRLGNRNSPPFLADTIQEFVAAGHKRLLAVLTSAYSSVLVAGNIARTLAERGFGRWRCRRLSSSTKIMRRGIGLLLAEITAGHVLAALA